MPSVLDTSALLALARNEPGADQVIDTLGTPGNDCYVHQTNLCEIYYATARYYGEDHAALTVHELLHTAGILPFASPDLQFIWEVGRLRARITSERLSASLADCFCIATARYLGCDLLTSDRREFEPVAALGLCQVLFIR
jgi:predicted nucleic acid-binding protein